jgi:hypothetical protein
MYADEALRLAQIFEVPWWPASRLLVRFHKKQPSTAVQHNRLIE